MSRTFVLTILAMVLVVSISGCAPGVFTNRQVMTRTVEGPNGLQQKETVVVENDRQGDAAMAAMGMAGGAASAAIGTALDTNFGQGYPSNRAYHYSGNYGYGFGYGGYGGMAPSVPAYLF